MKAKTVRFPDDVDALIEEQARKLGITVAQYVREAAVARVFFDLGVSRDPRAKEIADAYRLARESGPRPQRPPSERRTGEREDGPHGPWRSSCATGI